MKAKLIIEMPTNCYDCPFRRPSTLTYGYTCCVTLDSLKAYRSGDKIPKWCPLEPIIEPTTVFYTLKGPPFGKPVASDRLNAAVELLKTDPAIISTEELESCLRDDEYDTGWEK